MDLPLILYILYAFLGFGIYELFYKIGKYQRENQTSLDKLKDGLDNLDRKIEGCLSQYKFENGITEIKSSIKYSENILNSIEDKVRTTGFDVSLFERKFENIENELEKIGDKIKISKIS